MTAYAIRVTPANRQAIASEHRSFDLDSFNEWLEVHETGYFVRDTESTFDCQYLDDAVFHEVYKFESGDVDALFRKIQML